MKNIDIEDIDKLPGIQIKENDTFNFRCHPGVSCFNLCCRNLNLFLYPYDVVRLKHSLGVSSDRFLDEYVDVVLRPSNFFPEVLLRMSSTSDKACPFLTASGCSVYPDRPDTCRTFPIEQGTLYDARNNKDTPVYFFRPPDFYHKMTMRWAAVKRLFQEDPWGFEGPEGSKAKMAFMAAYNLDRFRDFIFQSSFLKRYKVKSTLLKKIKTDDVQLLKFGFEWIRFFIWGIKSKNIRIR